MPNRRGHDHIGNFNFKVELESTQSGVAPDAEKISIAPQSNGEMVLTDNDGNYIFSGKGSDSLELDGKLSPTDIGFSQQGDDLIITIDGSQVKLVIAEWFKSEKFMIESISAGSYQLDGSRLTEALTLHQSSDDAALILPELWQQAF